jgi:hypothetical protein
MKKAPRKAGLRLISNNLKQTHSKSLTVPQVFHLSEPLQRLQWLRQELNNWNEAGGDRPMPQPSGLDIPLPDLKPAQVYWSAP